MITISIDEVCETAAEMLDELAATTPLVHPQDASTLETDRLLVSVAIDIIGPFTTTMVVRMEVAGARYLSAAILGESLADVNQSGADETVAELANVIAGGVKGLVAEETHLGIPSTAHVVGKLGELEHAQVLDHELGRFEVGLVDLDIV